MDNRKRARFDTLASPNGVRTTTTTATTTTANTALPLVTLGGQSIFLSSSSLIDEVGAQLPANVFLTICDEPNTDDEEEDDDDAYAEEEATTTTTSFLTIDSSELAALALPHHQQQPQHHIKREQLEQEMGTQTTPPPQSGQAAPPLQYRLMQPNQLAPTRHAPESASLVTLPSGCEIYLVKEYVTSAASADDMPSALAPASPPAAIKIEPGVQFVRGGSEVGAGHVPPPSPCLITPKVTAPLATATPQPEEGNGRKRSFILEAYKKRDDKRRATHNEVERRRRDKINSWIFKLKEMLPPDMPTASSAAVTNCDSAQQKANASTNSNNNNNNNNTTNSRTPPSDSKSQILIKACEYIKAMQHEIKSLRECLAENEHLRLSNQRLQSELHKLKNERSHSQQQQQQQQFNVVTLNSLNGNGLFGVVNSVAAAAAATASGTATLVATTGSNGSRLTPQHTTASTYAKRELIIRDYVD